MGRVVESVLRKETINNKSFYSATIQEWQVICNLTAWVVTSKNLSIKDTAVSAWSHSKEVL